MVTSDDHVDERPRVAPLLCSDRTNAVIRLSVDSKDWAAASSKTFSAALTWVLDDIGFTEGEGGGLNVLSASAYASMLSCRGDPTVSFRDIGEQG